MSKKRDQESSEDFDIAHPEQHDANTAETYRSLTDDSRGSLDYDLSGNEETISEESLVEHRVVPTGTASVVFARRENKVPLPSKGNLASRAPTESAFLDLAADLTDNLSDVSAFGDDESSHLEPWSTENDTPPGEDTLSLAEGLLQKDLFSGLQAEGETHEAATSDSVDKGSWLPFQFADDFAESTQYAEQFGVYLLFSELGYGGMGEVRLGVEQGENNSSRLCVIKRLRPELAKFDIMRKMLLEEGRLCCAFDHPNIVKVTDYGERGSVPFIALELVDGVNLSTFQKWYSSGTLPLCTSLQIVECVAQALKYAHGLCDNTGKPLNIIHRDISPQNILIDRKGRVKLADFGIARSEGRDFESQAGPPKGKLAYSSPEQVEMRPLSQSVDIFGLGLVILELLTGETVFPRGIQDVQDIEEHVRELLEEVRGGIPVALTELVISMTRYSVEERISTIDHVNQRLKAILDIIERPTSIEEVVHDVIGENILPARELVAEIHRWAQDWSFVPLSSFMSVFRSSNGFRASGEGVPSLFSANSEPEGEYSESFVSIVSDDELSERLQNIPVFTDDSFDSLPGFPASAHLFFSKHEHEGALSRSEQQRGAATAGQSNAKHVEHLRRTAKTILSASSEQEQEPIIAKPGVNSVGDTASAVDVYERSTNYARRIRILGFVLIVLTMLLFLFVFYVQRVTP